ncbi:hypothetical protein IJS18_02835 [Candidatus Saccharibacteria bacterium]|nr:hypothetical protein [Candidatus Saccharibacteria bacterium]
MQGSNINIPFYVIVAVFSVALMFILGYNYIDVRKSERSNHRFVFIERFDMDVILAFAFGEAVILVVALVKHFITVPSNFFLKLVLTALIIGSTLLVTTVNVMISMFASRVSVDISERNLEQER